MSTPEVHTEAENAVVNANPDFKTKQPGEDTISYVQRLVSELTSWSETKYEALSDEIHNWYDEAVEYFDSVDGIDAINEIDEKDGTAENETDKE